MTKNGSPRGVHLPPVIVAALANHPRGLDRTPGTNPRDRVNAEQNAKKPVKTACSSEKTVKCCSRAVHATGDPPPLNEIAAPGGRPGRGEIQPNREGLKSSGNKDSRPAAALQTRREPLPETVITRARVVPIEREIEARGIRLQGRGPERTGPCPVCGGKDRFSINVQKQVWNCRGCAQGGGDAISLVRHLDGLDFRGAVALLAGSTPTERPQTVEAPPPKRDPKADEIVRRNAALVIWNQAVEPRGTLVEKYLNGRGLDLPEEAAF